MVLTELASQRFGRLPTFECFFHAIIACLAKVGATDGDIVAHFRSHNPMSKIRLGRILLCRSPDQNAT